MSFNINTLPDLSGRVFFITGGTAGLGAGAVSQLAAHNPAHVYFSGRDSKKADEVIQKVKAQHPNVPISFIQCDLTNLQSVKKAADEFNAKTDRLDFLYANAGIMATPSGTTSDGYEMQFGTNHMGHALLIKLLLPLLQRTSNLPGADVRIILTSSIAYKQAPRGGIAFETLKSPQNNLGGMIPGGKWSRYGQSKLANILYAQALAKRYPNIKSVSVHPGYVMTDMNTSTSFLTGLPVRILAAGNWTPVEEGHYNLIWAGTTPKDGLENGAYYVPIGKKGVLETKSAKDMVLADRLWEWTEQELASF